jgi:methylmalonyl-CoA mutase N-terminal domain/subunit
VKVQKKEIGGTLRFYEHAEGTETECGIPLKEVYGPEDLKDLNNERDIGSPGEFPYTRGTYPRGYRELLWIKSHITSPSDLEEANDRFKTQIARGQTGVRICNDWPSVHAMDSDHPFALNEIGWSGIPAWGLPCAEIAFKDMPLEDVDYEFAIPSPIGGLLLVAIFLAEAENKGADISKIRGTTINCLLGSYVIRSGHNFSLQLGRSIISDTIEFCLKYMPKFRPVVPCGYNIGEAGGNSVQQLALELSAAIGYYEDVRARGVDFDDFATRIAFSSHGGIDFFETVCKLRALRRMWAKIAKERFHAKKPKSCRAPVAMRSSGLSLTKQQPINNISRIAYQALSGVLGGANSIDLSGYDELYAIPTFEAQLINLNIHDLLACEVGVGRTADPLAGSWYIEWLTNKLEEEANKMMREIEERGGIFKAIEADWVGNLLLQEATKRQQSIERGEKLVIGVNKYRVPDEQPELQMGMPIYKPDLSKLRTKTLQQLKEHKERRDIEVTRNALENLYRAGQERNNLVRPAIEAMKAGATIQEAYGVIRRSWGESYDYFGMVSPPDFLDFL